MSHQHTPDTEKIAQARKEELFNLLVEKFNKEGETSFEKTLTEAMTQAKENSVYSLMDFLTEHKDILKEFYCYGYTDAKLDTTLKIMNSENAELLSKVVSV